MNEQVLEHLRRAKAEVDDLVADYEADKLDAAVYAKTLVDYDLSKPARNPVLWPEPLKTTVPRAKA